MNKIVFTFVLVSITWLLVIPVFAQSNSNRLEQEKQFIVYLIGTNQYREALFLINKYTDTSTNISLIDTLGFLKSKIYYNQEMLPQSISAINEITSDFIYYNELKILESYQWVHLGNMPKSAEILTNLSPTDLLSKELIRFEKASINLLMKDLETYENYKKERDTTYYQLAEAQQKLDSYAMKIKGFNSKSPFVAGLLSAVIPGTGKMYSGKIGEGVSTLLGMAILGAITYENYRYEGINNYKTITFGSLFTIFYAGNIFGSVYSVKIYREEFNTSINHAVLFNMHIPIRNIYPNVFK